MNKIMNTVKKLGLIATFLMVTLFNANMTFADKQVNISGKNFSIIGQPQINDSDIEKVAQSVLNFEKTGYNIGFKLIDVKTGNGIAYNEHIKFYAASTMKGPFSASLVALHPMAINESKQTILSVLQYSSNDGYVALYNKYGNSYIRKWATEAGVDPNLGNLRYPNVTAHELNALWQRNYTFFESGETGRTVATWFQNPNLSPIKSVLSQQGITTQSKAGWIGYPDYHSASDSGIVRSKYGDYVVTIMSDADAKLVLLNPIVSSLHEFHRNMVLANSDQLVTDSTGRLIYQRNGKQDTQYSGLILHHGIWYYVKNGSVDMTYSTVTHYQGNDYYVHNGKVSWHTTGLISVGNEKYYVVKGTVQKHVTTLIQDKNGTWYYVRNGQVDYSYSNLTYYHGTWYYVKNGIIDWTYENIVYYYGTHYYVKDAQIMWGKNGFVTVNNKKYYLENTVVKTNYTGLLQDKDKTWYYVKNGQVDYSFSNLTHYYGTWYYVKNGVIDWTYENIVYYYGTYYYVKDAQITWGKNGFVTVNNKKYYLENTAVKTNYTGLLQDKDKTWYYVKEGQVDYSFSNLTYYHGTWYYVKNGVIDWTYENIVHYYGTYYYVKDAQITWGFDGQVKLNNKTYTIQNSIVKNVK